MRNPKRIEDVLSRIRKIWHIYPDLRLGQLLINVIGLGRDPFYVEDDDLVKMIEDYQKDISNKS